MPPKSRRSGFPTVKVDLSDDYANSAYIDGADDLPEIWAAEALSFRTVEHAIGRARLNLPYGPMDRQALDLFLPAGTPQGLLVFVHGGFWMQCDRTDFSHFARGATQAGWAVALPSYPLAPKARVAAITQNIAQAVEHAARLIAGPVIVAGHSAGGHLAARMNCGDVALGADLAQRICRIIAISPLSDLRPLMQTAMNATLRLDENEAAAESPVLATRRRAIETLVCVGAEERPAFLNQALALGDAWPEAELHVAPGRHHFDILDLLLQPDGLILRRLST